MRHVYVPSCALFLFFFSFSIESALSQLAPEQRHIMLSISSHIWNTSNPDPCKWKGVTCNGNSVTEISLSGVGINSSSVLTTFCQLGSLQKLDFSRNSVKEIPPGFTNSCSGLKVLNLSSNGLSGNIPPFDGMLSLETLDLSANSLEGEVSLQFDGLVGLKSLNLSSNSLGGSLPSSLGKAMALEELHLSANHFVGRIPEKIFDYTNLILLDLSENNVSGSLPHSIGKLSKLKFLVLSTNKLVGTIPQSLLNIPTLFRFAAHQNGFTGTIPSGITSSLHVLDLSFNYLEGLIPLDLLPPVNLQSVDLSSNRLVGHIPRNLSKSLFRLRLGGNLLSGSIPLTVGELPYLTYFEVDYNNLSGEIPLELQRCKSLSLLNLANNALSGSVPPQLGNLSELGVLKLNRNNLRGEIPKELSQLQNLFTLNLSQNSLSGRIPDTIFQLPKLQFLDLGGNMLNGSIPSTAHNSNSLLELQLGNNRLTNPIPLMPPRLSLTLNLSSNLFQGRIPNSLQDLRDLGVLDLSHNEFTGEVPLFLTQMGSLMLLILSNNRLSGTLPPFTKNVMVNTTGNKDLLIPNPHPTSPGKKSSSHAILTVVAIIGAISALGLVVFVLFLLRRAYRVDTGVSEMAEEQPQVIEGHLLTANSTHKSNIDFEKAMEAASDPTNIILKNKFSTYYKVTISSGTSYCVKKHNWSDKIFHLGNYRKFREELSTIAKLSHSNVVTPLAYFLTSESVYLFYEYVHKGTLFEFLHQRVEAVLDWPCRYSIALGLAQGLAFLHGCTNPILHLDLSTRSIFLKSNSEPLIADIELCKIIDPSKSTGSLSTISGSVGYIPPEYAYTMRITTHGNVYSFGVILLELLTGEPAVCKGRELTKWVMDTPSRNETWESILDSRISSSSTSIQYQMLQILKVAQACVSVSWNARPKMRTVVRMLQNVK
ncbi:hypothetical protein AMTRI_Chr11g98020 [Amborella trichopoda]